MSPVNNLLDGNLNGAELRYFSTYAGGNHVVTQGNQQLNQAINIGDSSNQNLQRAQSVTESIYEYHPIKATTITTVNKQPSPVVNFSTGNNGIQKSFESHSYTTGY